MNSLQNKKVLVTGATGFLGSRLAELLAAREGATVTGQGRNLEKASSLEEKGITLKKADLLNTDELASLVEGMDYIFHAAAMLEGDRETGQKVNVNATRELIRLAGKAGASRFIHISTVGVYDMPREGDIDESYPLAIHHPSMYNATKAQAEIVAAEMAKATNIELSIIRPSMIYGPGPGIWSEGMFKFILNKEPVFMGDGSTHFLPVYIDDVCEAAMLCAKVPEAAGEAFNISDVTTNWKYFMKHYAAIADTEPKGIPLFIAKLMAWGNKLPGVDLPIDQGLVEMMNSHNTFSTQKARKILGWKARTSLEEGLQKTTEWLRNEVYEKERG